MPKIELVYFGSCPHIETARSAIRAAGISDFHEINLDESGERCNYQRYSSPSIIIDGRLVVGSESDAIACSMIDWSMVAPAIRTSLKTRN